MLARFLKHYANLPVLRPAHVNGPREWTWVGIDLGAERIVNFQLRWCSTLHDKSSEDFNTSVWVSSLGTLRSLYEARRGIYPTLVLAFIASANLLCMIHQISREIEYMQNMPASWPCMKSCEGKARGQFWSQLASWKTLVKPRGWHQLAHWYDWCR